MPKSANILISGSGIAASVCSFWLLRAFPDASITIVERAPTLRLTGASVDIRSSAVDIIKKMGVEPEIRESGTKESGIQYVKGNDRSIGVLGATGRTDVQSITSEYEIFRGELAKIFLKPVQSRLKLIFDESVEHFEQDSESVTVRFARSKKTEKYDMLIAADGMGSKIRGMMLNKPSREQIHDEGVHVAYFTINRDLLGGSSLAKWYNATGGRVVFLRPDPDPKGRTRGNLMNVRWRSDTSAKKRFDDAMEDGPEAYMQVLEDTFADAGWLSAEVLKGMRESDDFYCSLFAQARSPILHSGRVVLLGDAGYATPGFGTSLAIMGGYVLAGELLRVSQQSSLAGNWRGEDIETAFSRYANLIQPFVKGSQGDDIAMQLLNPQTNWGITIRNMVLRIVTGLRIDQMAMMMAAKLGLTETMLKMPDYPWPQPKG